MVLHCRQSYVLLLFYKRIGVGRLACCRGVGMRFGSWLWLTASGIALASAARAGETVTYRYDALGRLTGSSSSGTVNNGATSSIGYDAAGNRSIYGMSVSGAPAFSVSEAGALEGGGLVFTVIKSGTGAASVSYASANGSAGSGGDYHGVSGSLSFAADESVKTVAVATIDDSADEPNETLSLNLSAPSSGSTIADGQGIGTIFDNDEPPPPPPPGNTAPTAVNDTGSMLRCSSKAFNVLANDSDADGAIDLPLTIVGVAGYNFSHTSTQIWVDSTGLSSGAYGVYTVRDARGAQSTATLTITISGGSCTQ